jgi:hypothetical protein
MVDEPSFEVEPVPKVVDRELAVVNNWYEKGMKELFENSKTQDFEQIKSRIDERSDQAALRMARQKLEQFTLINNPHKYKP